MRKVEHLLRAVQELDSEAQSFLARTSELTFVALREVARDLSEDITQNYQHWYTKALVLVGRYLPEDRVDEFVRLYGPSFLDVSGTRALLEALWDDQNARAHRHNIDSFRRKVRAQLGMVSGIPKAAQLEALGLRELLAADLMADEAEVAQHLLETGFVRPAGVVAGVVLERQLKNMCERRHIEVGERETIGSLNSKLKEHYDDPADYRKVAWMAELRATCGHDKKAEPTAVQVTDLIEAVKKFVSTVS